MGWKIYAPKLLAPFRKIRADDVLLKRIIPAVQVAHRTENNRMYKSNKIKDLNNQVWAGFSLDLNN